MLLSGARYEFNLFDPDYIQAEPNSGLRRKTEMLEEYTVNLSEEEAKVEQKVLEIDSAKVDVIVSVQEELNGSVGILREGTLAYTIDSKARRVSDKNIRDETITYGDHISRFEDNDPARRKVLAFVGNGNLLMNPWFVAWANRNLFQLRDERKRGNTGKEPYSSLVVWKERRVSIENIWFRDGRIKVDDYISGKDITEEVIYTTYGQRLMERGRFILPFAIKDQYYDLRHLLLLPFFSDKEGYFGLNELETDSKKRGDALKKLPVELDFKGDESRAKEKLREKGYQAVEKVNEEGQYRISGDRICISFKSGLFPHNIIGIAEGGKVVSIIITGKSNTAGLMLDKADKLFRDLKERHEILVKDAILLDNGGDVMMQYRGKMVAESFMSPPRDRLRSVILFVAGRGGEEGIRLVEG